MAQLTQSLKKLKSLELKLPRISARPVSAAVTNMARPHIDLGISLGSSEVTVVAGKTIVTEPSRVAVDHKAQIIALGRKALDMEGRESRGVRVIQPLEEGVVTDLEWARRLLEHALRSNNRAKLGQARAVVAMQADLSAGERQALLDVVRAAGVRRVHPLDQGLVAAVGADCPVLEARGSLVVHLGAGATQVTVVSLGSTVVSRTIRVGGDHMNAAIREYVRHEHLVLLDERGAEALKRAVGCAMPIQPATRFRVPGRELTRGRPALVEIGSDEVARLLEPLVAAIVAEVRLVLAEISPELLRDIVQEGIVLTGGGAQLQLLDERLGRETRVRVRRSVEPQRAVARGLGRIQADGELRRALLRTPHESPSRTQARPRKLKGWLAALVLLTATSATALYNMDSLKALRPSPVDTALSGVVTPAVSLASHAAATGADRSDQAALAESERKIRQLIDENKRLWNMFGRRFLSSTPRPVVARVAARDPRGWLSFLNLDVGSGQGIEKGMVVTSAQGLVGRVFLVSPNSSRVRLITDSGMTVAGILPKHKTAGMLVGSGGRTLEMRFLSPDVKIRTGDQVVTSGQDGLYPPGLVVGKVSRVLPPTDSSFQSVIVQPASRFDELYEASVLRGEPADGRARI